MYECEGVLNAAFFNSNIATFCIKVRRYFTPNIESDNAETQLFW